MSPSASPEAAGRRLVVAERVADRPERRRPEADEDRAPFRVSTLVLVDRLGADPEADAETHRPERGTVPDPVAEAGAVQQLRHHRPEGCPTAAQSTHCNG